MASDESMARHARRVRQRERLAAKALVADIPKAESHTLALLVPGNPYHRNPVMVDVAGSDHEGSIIDLTSTSDVKAMGSDKEE